jgi:hypothetical protein
MRYSTIKYGKVESCEATPVFDISVDVCVVGLGTSGSMAAICAGENGLSVVGIEKNSVMGGVATAATVWDYYYGTYGGKWEEINAECHEIIKNGYARISPTDDCAHNRGPSVNGAVKSYVLEKHALAAGCKLYYNSVLAGVYMDGSKVCGVRIFDGYKYVSIKSKYVIDGADAAVCRMTGIDMLKGRDSDNNTLRFSKSYGAYHGGYIRGSWGSFFFPDSKDEHEFTEKIIYSTLNGTYLKDKYESEGRMIYEGSMMGKREVWGAVTDEVYTFSDYVAGKQPNKPVIVAYAPLDNSNPDLHNENVMMQNWRMLCNMHIYCFSVEIPMGALIPKGLDGIMVIGKGIGLGHDMMAATRMKADLEKIGEVAATMAKLAISQNVSVRDIDYPELVAILKDKKCYSPEQHIGLCNGRDPDDSNKLWTPVPKPQSVEEYRAMLDSTNPCVAMWYILWKDTALMREHLVSWLDSDSDLLRENSAVTLGVINDERCIPELRRILAGERKTFSFDHGPHRFGWYRYTTHVNYDKAILLLGRFKDKESLEAIEKIADSDIPVASDYAKVAVKAIKG